MAHQLLRMWLSVKNVFLFVFSVLLSELIHPLTEPLFGIRCALGPLLSVLVT